jgi:hypothetical protein
MGVEYRYQADPKIQMILRALIDAVDGASAGTRVP